VQSVNQNSLELAQRKCISVWGKSE